MLADGEQRLLGTDRLRGVSSVVGGSPDIKMHPNSENVRTAIPRKAVRLFAMGKREHGGAERCERRVHMLVPGVNRRLHDRCEVVFPLRCDSAEGMRIWFGVAPTRLSLTR